jgi:hypothetical protein
VTSTVLLLGGAFSNLQLNNYMPTQLQGAITNGNTAIIVPYNTNGLFLSTVQQGAAMLNTYLTAGTGPMVAFGHSLGAVVCNYWLSNYVTGPISTTTISPANLSFVWIGNSVRVYGGALGPETGAWLRNWFGAGVTVPSGTSFQCLDITRQFDGWADWPTGTGGGLFDAEMNAFSGQGSIHPNYQNVNPSPAAPGNVSYTVGNITYIWSTTEPVPLYGTTWSPAIQPLDQSVRPIIESAYNRPVYIPGPFDTTIAAPTLTVMAVIPVPTAATSTTGGLAAPVMAATASMPAPTLRWPVPTVTATIPAPTLAQALPAPAMAGTATIPTPTVV